MQRPVQPLEPELDFSTEGFSVADLLEARAITLRKRRKRVRTKAALIATAARELEKNGFDSLTVEGISEAAGMARGTFYLYYHSRSDITAAVIKYYWALIRIHRPKGGGKLDLRNSIHRMNNFSAHLAMKNARLLSGRETLTQENPAIAARFRSINLIWANRIVQDVLTRTGRSADHETREFLHLKARAAITMSDALLRDIYWNYNPNGEAPPIDLEMVVRVMDDLWFRSLYMDISKS